MSYATGKERKRMKNSPKRNRPATGSAFDAPVLAELAKGDLCETNRMGFENDPGTTTGGTQFLGDGNFWFHVNAMPPERREALAQAVVACFAEEGLTVKHQRKDSRMLAFDFDPGATSIPYGEITAAVGKLLTAAEQKTQGQGRERQ